MLTSEQREEILALHMVSPEAASHMAISHGLKPDYACKLAHARGMIPRTKIRWGKLREVEA